MVLLAAAAAPAAAQQQRTQAAKGPPRSWGTIAVLWYPDAGNLTSPVENAPQDGSDTQQWQFGSGFGLAAAYQRQLGPGLEIGADVSYAPSVGVELSGAGITNTVEGHAGILSAMATARLTTGGGGPLGLYLAGGAGTFVYHMPSPVDKWDPDLGFRTSAGAEYQWQPRRALFLEWGKSWAFHQHQGVKSNTNRFSQLRAGIRIGW